MDPQTKQIYHPTFNPVPAVKGLAEKLVELPTLEETEILQSVEKYGEQKNGIQAFYSLFGIESIHLTSYQEIDEGEENILNTLGLINQKIEVLLKEKYVII
jgi:hypothetical protein